MLNDNKNTTYQHLLDAVKCSEKNMAFNAHIRKKQDLVIYIPLDIFGL